MDARITSTYVENTGDLYRRAMKRQDHLHLRGEHPRHLLETVNELGSPPLTWRTRLPVESS